MLVFQPTQISSLGAFQDGGLKHNNQINLALWESCCIWPSVSQPDIVLSLDTGTNTNQEASLRSRPMKRFSATLKAMKTYVVVASTIEKTWIWGFFIFVQSNIQGRRRISGFPQTMRWFCQQQGLDAHFGKPFHDSKRACGDCTSREPSRYRLVPKREGEEHYL